MLSASILSQNLQRLVPQVYLSQKAMKQLTGLTSHGFSMTTYSFSSIILPFSWIFIEKVFSLQFAVGWMMIYEYYNLNEQEIITWSAVCASVICYMAGRYAFYRYWEWRMLIIRNWVVVVSITIMLFFMARDLWLASVINTF